MSTMRTRREFIGEGVGGLLASSFGTRPYHTAHPERNAAFDERPMNAVVFMCDEHNPHISSVYGHPIVQTPNLDRLAARGTVFENAYCPSPLCAPCRSAFMSGKRVHEIQCYSNCNVFRFDYPTYGQVLHDEGVHTVHIGKTDVFREGPALGFSETILPGDRTPPGDTLIQHAPLAIRPDGAKRADGFGPQDSNPFQKDDSVIAAALEWLADKPKQLDRPWVLVIQLVKPHFPMHVTQELWDMYADAADLPAFRGDATSANHPYALDLRAHFQTDQFRDDQVRGLRRGYLGLVTYVDRQLGRVLDAIDQHDLEKTTNVFYTSDHGEMLGKFGMWWKSSLYEDSARVPLIAAGPGFARGTRVRTPVDLHDMRASVFYAVRKRQPYDWSGEALQRIWKRDRSRVAFSEYHGHGVRGSGYVVRKDDWKLIYCAKAPHQLFNVEDDPDELRNLADKNAKKLRELEEELRAICDPEVESERAEAFIARQLEAIAAMRAAANSHG
ncbi:MAG: sulfatase-like hydrolase/transferase [Candidatus Hydrogenedentes bacterium]|nr:sulfatase-like hydrolase/transferase [Candidatus Hydrogenedentota bacterium]